jgi:hypothetical protein
MSLVNIAFALAFAFTGQASAAKKPERSAAVGDLLVTVTRVWLPRVSGRKLQLFESGRFHLVAVEIAVKNVSTRISNTSVVPSLKVKPDMEYHAQVGVAREVGISSPNFYQLLPGEESRGGYVFVVRNGATPVNLNLFSNFKTSSIELAGLVETESAR